jgi:hypothetical protein
MVSETIGALVLHGLDYNERCDGRQAGNVVNDVNGEVNI